MAKKQKVQKVPVSERALIQRINRKLKREDQQMRAARGFYDDQGRWYEDSNLGRYYVVDLKRNFISSTHVDPEKWGREIKVLKPWEELAEDSAVAAT